LASSLLHAAGRGEPDAIRACLDAFGGLVWSLARKSSPTREDAEDAVQEIFLALWKNASRYDAKLGSEAVFVATIARRRLIDRARARKRVIPADPVSEPRLPPSGSASAEVCVEASRAAEAMTKLRPEQRDILLLATVHGLTHEEIATMRGMPLGTVKTHARRALIRMRQMLVNGSDEAEEVTA
jgi:RNA polymerase sigma-70 factor (ECF subfamily)